MRRRVSFACLPAVVGALLAAPAAPAATLSVDDDRQDCTAAAYTSVQDAIDAAAPGDTVAICPGHYAEGNGPPNTNALKIDKTITLKGAGADLVTITPRRYDGNDGVIADDQDDSDARLAAGHPLPVGQHRHRRRHARPCRSRSTSPASPFDGDGVDAKAGVVFLDAQGSLRAQPRHRHRHLRGARRVRDARRLPLRVPRLRRRAGHRRADRPGRRRPAHAGDRQHAHRRVQPRRRPDRRRHQRPDAGHGLRRRPARRDLDLADRRPPALLGHQRRRRLRRPDPGRQPRPEADRRRPAVRPGRRPPRRPAPAARSRAR